MRSLSSAIMSMPFEICQIVVVKELGYLVILSGRKRTNDDINISEKQNSSSDGN
jgi:hypothetical protein